MAYIAEPDFRTGTLAEYCAGLALSTTEAPPAAVTSAIARLSQRVNDLTGDFFESQNIVYDLVGDGSTHLVLPARCTSISSVKVISYTGVATTQAATLYRLISSLDATGAVRWTRDGEDYLAIIPGQFLTGLSYGIGDTWPVEQESVEVTGAFGWLVCPGDIKRAVALMVYDNFKAFNPALRQATSYTTVDASYAFTPIDPDHPTGITEVDAIVLDYRRYSGVLLG